MPKISKYSVGKGAAYIYIETIASMVSGYAFWIIMSKISPTDIIGTSSALVSLAGIFIVVSSLGIPSGLPRFLGKYFAEQKIADARFFFRASLVLICVGILASSAIILLLKNWVFETFTIDLNLLFVALLLIGSAVLAQLFRSVFISDLNTRMLPPIMIGTSIAKIVLAVALVSIGTGALGIMIGYAFNQILTSLFLGILIISTKIFRMGTAHVLISVLRYKQVFKDILTASMTFWIPYLITTIGTQLGPIVVFGYQGSHEAGVYFIALAIVSGITSIMYSLFTISLPALSAMHDGRKRFTWQTIRLSGIIILPFSFSIFFYSEEILQLIGQDYADASLSLEILLLSMLPTMITYGVQTLVFSAGNYRQYLAIGLATSIPRTILYLLLVPLTGGTGAAASYTAGALIGFGMSVILAKTIGMQLFWKDLIMLIVIPTGLALGLDYAKMNYLLAVPISLIISYTILYKMQVLLSTDIKYLLNIMPPRISKPLAKLLRSIKK